MTYTACTTHPQANAAYGNRGCQDCGTTLAPSIRWNQQDTGSLLAAFVGGAYSLEALITPTEDGRWFVIVRHEGTSTTHYATSAKAAKRWARRFIRSTN